MARLTRFDKTSLEELQKGREALLSGATSRTLLSALRRRLQTITHNLYIVSWIPEEAEDIYDVLVDGKTVVRIEISRSGKEHEESFRSWPVAEYVRVCRLAGSGRRKLDLAVRLAEDDRTLLDAMRKQTSSFVREMVARFPGLRTLLDEHIQDNNEILPHVFFNDVTDYVVSLLSSDLLSQRRELRDVLNYLEEAFAGGDYQVQELISVSFLESLPRPDEEGARLREMVGPRLKAELDLIG